MEHLLVLVLLHLRYMAKSGDAATVLALAAQHQAPLSWIGRRCPSSWSRPSRLHKRPAWMHRSMSQEMLSYQYSQPLKMPRLAGTRLLQVNR